MIIENPTFLSVLVQMFTLCPELIKFLTIPDPMMPNPKNPKDSVEASMFLFFKFSDTLFMSIFGVS